jgi:hypothetical protein
MQKRFAAFLSFASHDRKLVKALNDLFWQLGMHTFFAPISLARAGSPEWRKTITEGMKHSDAFVPIYTRQSINRRWVLYESGLADACKLPRFPAKVCGIDHSEIEDLPGPGALVYDLSNRDSLVALIINVICAKNPEDKDAVEADVRRVVHQSKLTNEILTLSKTRWVFIAGNKPVDEAALEADVKWFTAESEYEARLKAFVIALTESLIAGGFSITACPQVDAVGLHVINTAADILALKPLGDHLDYRISGIYPIDRNAENINLSPNAKKHWVAHIMKFRRSYLADQEWIILVGGNQGTRDEYEAAVQCRVKAFAVPCFGGAGLKVWNEGHEKSSPCCLCAAKSAPCGGECAGKIAQYLKSWRSDA